MCTFGEACVVFLQEQYLLFVCFKMSVLGTYYSLGRHFSFVTQLPKSNTAEQVLGKSHAPERNLHCGPLEIIMTSRVLDPCALWELCRARVSMSCLVFLRLVVAASSLGPGSLAQLFGPASLSHSLHLCFLSSFLSCQSSITFLFWGSPLLPVSQNLHGADYGGCSFP